MLGFGICQGMNWGQAGHLPPAPDGVQFSEPEPEEGVAMRAERQIVFWLTAAALLILTIALLKDILLPFVVGITIAYFLNPIVDRLSGWGVNRVVASLLIVAAGAVLLDRSAVPARAAGRDPGAAVRRDACPPSCSDRRRWSRRGRASAWGRRSRASKKGLSRASDDAGAELGEPRRDGPRRRSGAAASRSSTSWR